MAKKKSRVPRLTRKAILAALEEGAQDARELAETLDRTTRPTAVQMSLVLR